ncbi:SusC/RagA family TonB-linked outer membrane protein [Flavilitoribacter nigricans]|uniref:SusC/RagA family TonB-linked outer membrane protein n=1 Tax=Flavilitoribacter nigricans (strain ATCC 23147 / DSM 23189 / NBRC 102662 / NCIMB 1420 / SS-2) TaxID=1122177 RepID=A0A2D0MY63_FLAN2|nr:SusC/RagA family TonB-linked outer membrane protein [Flavilitoribacter nigricans]PHN01221.1 SusC/RagA family TonB-linked outer membrane protein [Flavilitoribacter nigricans DSM 23189 = NBRC 102662]
MDFTRRVASVLRLVSLCIAFCSLTAIQSFAQRTVNGTVTSAADNQPLIGVNVYEKGTSSGTITDLDGNFTIQVADENASLVFSYVGFTEQEVALNGRTQIAIALAEGVTLDEAVVTALNITRDEKSLGYALQQVSGDDVSAVNGSNFVSTLAGRAAGVNVVSNGQASGSASVVIRGMSSLSSNNQPLFIVDGIPINNETDTRTSTNGIADNMHLDYGNGAAEINPDDIASVSVLKGANATALYGSRAANGAIIITTKSGKNRKGIGVEVSSKTTFESMLAGPEYQREYGQGKNFDFAFVDGYGNGTFDGVDESWGPRLDGTLRAQHDSPTANGLRGGDVHGLDFILGSSGVDLNRRGAIQPTPFDDPGDPVKNFMENGRTLINNISFFGSNDNGNFRVSYTNFDNTGILPNTDLRRNTVTFSGDYDLSDRLRVSAKANYIRSESDNRPVNGYGTESVMYLFIWWGQNVSTESLRDYWQRGLEGFQQFNYNYNYHDNPYFTMYENTNALSKDRIIGNLSATYDITDDLSLMLRGGTDMFSEYRFIKRAYSTQRFPNGQYREDKVNFRETNIDFLLSYKKQVNDDWFVSANFGGNQMQRKNHFQGISANKLLIPGVYSFTNADGPLVQSISRPEQQINSLYAFAQVGYKSMLYLDLTARNDWSSTLPEANNSYFYPSASLSAVLTEMFDVPSSSALSFAKLRLGWAQVGSDTDPYRLSDPFFFGSTPWGNNATASPSNTLPNFDLKPEIQTSVEVGADLRFFNGRIGLDATYYNTVSKNQILAIDLPHSSGKTSRVINAGKIENQGVEILLSLNPIRTSSGFNWNTMFNFGLNRNKVLELPDGVDQYVYGGNGITLVAKEGGSLGDMWGTGLKRVEDPNSPYYGEIIFNDGLVQQDNTLRKLGNYNPDFTLGWMNELSYKNFSLSFLFDGRQGGELLSRTRLIAATSGNVVETLWGRAPEFGGAHPGITDSGISYIDESTGETKTDGVIGDGVMEVTDDNGNVIGYTENTVDKPANAYHNNRYRRNNESEGIYDATFIKLREARLSYTLPKSVLGNTFVNSLRISLIGNNLLLWAKEFNHGDPELLSFGGGRYIPGVENATVPSTRSIGFSVNVGF